MAKYTVSRKINDKETITVEQSYSFDEAFDLLDRGQRDRDLQLKRQGDEAQQIINEDAKREANETPEETTGEGDSEGHSEKALEDEDLRLEE